MTKERAKLLHAGVLSVAAVGLIAGCATDDETDTELDPETAEEEIEEVEEDVEEELDLDEDTEETEDNIEETEEDIVAIAQGDPEFSILVSALQEAELVETLQGEGPFTVFAPTDEAFEALLSELDITAEELLGQPDLGSILTYHVIPSEVMAGDLEDGQTAETVHGEELTFDLSGDPMVNDAAITTTDIEASNGVIHAIDTVLIPSDFELQE
ncbi:Uncaracterized surface protein containing fasciclin (FAS1) repeats [Alkalibacterium subtropicum]|uniref:Uncaracterized surface protein containing fasciclin (FAS1) repeats n=1 Tax=Alkalibacterium subtropicum TaxID=753702 RepID=A0A1I1L165_9LACT|nr:fasciclin domain-containing protein [Alkalibacterium subtropicum]SFC66799.1 Uncaracterized surface protein containing fasciclin (FAS1) repeats [Alkalibacterium subtropicum]